MGYNDNLHRVWQTDHGALASDTKLASGGSGTMPNFVERIRGTLKFPVSDSYVLTAWDLDEDGNRVAPLDVTYEGAGSSRIASIDLPVSPVSPWYEFGVSLANTPFTMSCSAANGYVDGATAIGVNDTALAANAVQDTEAPFRNVRWVSTTTATGISDLDVLRATSAATYPGDPGYSLSLFDGGSGRGAKLDLRGQNVPIDKEWSFEVALRFDSTSLNEDEIHALIGQDRSMPVVEVALIRSLGQGSYKLKLNTKAGWVDLPDSVPNATYVKVKVTVTPPNVGMANPNGRMLIYVDGVQKLLGSTLELPSARYLPEELHLFTGDTTTGIARVDAIKVTIP
jgi:hypothetical protein